MEFDLNSLQLTSKDYWGAEKDQFFEQFYGLPFAPFNKMEKIGRCCDFSQKLQQKIVTLNEEEDNWKDIDVKQKSKYNYKKKIQAKNINQNQNKKPGQFQQKPQTNPRQNNRQQQWFNRTKFGEANIIKTDWENIYEFNKTHLDKLTIAGKVEGTVLFSCGSIYQYDKSYDKKKYSNKKQLQVQDKFLKASNQAEYVEKMSKSPNVFHDEYLTKLISEDETKNLVNPVVYTTDFIITALMTLKQSNFPFEMEVQKIKNQIIIDKLSEVQNSYLDLYTANENITGDLPENEQDLLKLCQESTIINQNFKKQVCNGPIKKLGEGGAELEDDRDVGFIYKKYTIEKKMDLIIRSEVDAYQNENDFLLVRALNEYDLTNDWRKKLETNKGWVLTQELRNNSCKITKWICQAQLSGIDTIKLAYITRNVVKDDKKHTILDIETHKIQDLVANINFRYQESWSIVKFIVEIVSKFEDGRYVFIKSPWKPSIKIYKCPNEEEEEEEDDKDLE